jgi:hypothetical protein
VRKVLAETSSPEVRRRAAAVLEVLQKRAVSLEAVREQRALHVLESLGTPEDRKVVEALAKGAADASLTAEAKAALARWRR